MKIVSVIPRHGVNSIPELELMGNSNSGIGIGIGIACLKKLLNWNWIGIEIFWIGIGIGIENFGIGIGIGIEICYTKFKSTNNLYHLIWEFRNISSMTITLW